MLTRLVASDRLFQTDPELAYAASWGMTYFLSSNKPDQYLEYLRKDGRRYSFSTYPSQKRLSDFAQAFGTDLERLEIEMIMFLFVKPAKKKPRKSK